MTSGCKDIHGDYFEASHQFHYRFEICNHEAKSKMGEFYFQNCKIAENTSYFMCLSGGCTEMFRNFLVKGF